jgi:hypothetical protein
MLTESEAIVAAADPGSTTTDSPPGLQRLLDAARSAGPRDRISYRDLIASYGGAAITAVTPWLADRVLSAFAIRVIQYAGANGDCETAIRTLKEGRASVPPFCREDVDYALRQLFKLLPVTSGHVEPPESVQRPRSAAASPRPRRAASPREIPWTTHRTGRREHQGGDA